MSYLSLQPEARMQFPPQKAIVQSPLAVGIPFPKWKAFLTTSSMEENSFRLQHELCAWRSDLGAIVFTRRNYSNIKPQTEFNAAFVPFVINPYFNCQFTVGDLISCPKPHSPMIFLNGVEDLV